MAYLFMCIQIAYALEVSLDAPNLDSGQNKNGQTVSSVPVGKTFRLNVVISGDRDKKIELDVDGLQNFSVRGKSQSTSIVFANGQYFSDITYSFDLQALHQGTLTLGPAHVAQGDKKAVSNALQIQVVAPSSLNASMGQQQTKSQASEPELFCRLDLDKKRVVVGEPVEAVLSIYTRGQILQVAADPVFKGFLFKEMKQRTQEREQVKGKEFDVWRRRYILLPLQQGTKEIEPITVMYTFQKPKAGRDDAFGDDFFAGFFNTARVYKGQKETSSISLEVEPIPAYQGHVDGVGLFKKYSATLDKKETTVNEPVLLRLELEGKGNLEQIATPLLVLPAGVKSYKSKSEIVEDLTQDYRGGKKTFEFVVQPTKAGNMRILGQTFTFFNYESKTFQTLTTDPLDINVLFSQESKESNQTQQETQDKEPEKPGQKREESRTENQDVHFIEEERGTGHKEERVIPLWLFILLLFLPLALLTHTFLPRFLVLMNVTWLTQRLRKKMLHKAETDLHALIDQGKMNELYHRFLNYLALKFNTPVQSVTEKWITETLMIHGWPLERVNEFIDFLGECASLHFVTQREGVYNYQKMLKKANYWLLLLNK